MSLNVKYSGCLGLGTRSKTDAVINASSDLLWSWKDKYDIFQHSEYNQVIRKVMHNIRKLLELNPGCPKYGISYITFIRSTFRC